MLIAQKDAEPIKKEVVKKRGVVEVENTSIREEIQRYIGYEPLFYRYMTLPLSLIHI